MDEELVQQEHTATSLNLMERTLALIKPDAIDKAAEIEDVVIRHGFTVLQKRTLQLSPEQCSEFYVDQYEKEFFPSLTAFMSSGPVMALALTRHQAIAVWKDLMGPANITEARVKDPDCLRARYGTSDLRNAVHGSETFSAAERELKFMFPHSSIKTIAMDVAAKEYLSRFINPTLLKGLTELCKTKPSDSFIWLADWLMKNNPNKPQISKEAVVKDVA